MRTECIADDIKALSSPCVFVYFDFTVCVYYCGLYINPIVCARVFVYLVFILI